MEINNIVFIFANQRVTMRKRVRGTNSSNYISYQDLKQYGLGSVLQETPQQGGGMNAAQAIPLIGPISQMGVAAGRGIGGDFGGAVSGAFDPAALLADPNLSTSDKIKGAINPILGGIRSQRAREKQERAVAQQQKIQNTYTEAQNRFQSNQVANPSYSYTPTYRCGGRLKRYNLGGPEVPEVPTNAGIYDYKIGYSGQQLAPHSEIMPTIQEITVPKYRYATDSQPSGYYRTMTTRTPEGMINTREFSDKSWNEYISDPTNASWIGRDTRYKHLLPQKAMGGTLNYGGQLHSDSNGGNPVDSKGNINISNPTALVQKGEVSYNAPNKETYIFSDDLLLDKGKSFAREAKQIQSKYKKRLGKNMIEKQDALASKGYNMDMQELMNKQEMVREVNGINDEEKMLFGGAVEENQLAEQMEKGGFMGIKKSHKGWCTPMTKPTCTGARRRLALTLKKHHGFHKKEDGGTLNEWESDMRDYLRYTPEGEGNLVNSLPYNSNYTAEEMGMQRPDPTLLTDEQLKIAAKGDNSLQGYSPYQGMGWESAASLAAPLLGNYLNLREAKRTARNRVPLRAAPLTPSTINLERERAAAREQANLTRANAARALREGASGGQYLANVANTNIGIQRGLGQQLGESYQREEIANAAARERAEELNREMGLQVDVYNRQQSDMDSARKQQYINNMLNAVNMWGKDMATSRQNAQAMNMMYPDYQMYQEDFDIKKPFKRRQFKRVAKQ